MTERETEVKSNALFVAFEACMGAWDSDELRNTGGRRAIRLFDQIVISVDAVCVDVKS